MEWDVFISHASEDKASVARPLAELLQQAGLKIWLDASELTVGDSLSRKIDEGLAHSTYGVVILSEPFFRKRWPPHELAGLVARQMIGGRKVILPIWHGVDHSFIVRYSPPLADVVAANTKDGLEKVAADIVLAVRSVLPGAPAGGTPRTAFFANRKWLFFGVVLLLFTLVLSGILLFRHPPPTRTHTPAADDYNRELFSRYDHAPISGYFVVSCNTCGRPRAWAFYESRSKDGSPQKVPELDAATRGTTSRPMVEFLYPEDKPEIGWCVDFPQGVCLHEQNESIWKPTHDLQKPKARTPVLDLDLRLLISGFELGVSNKGDVLAQGINVDVAAWQTRSPGIEFHKSYSVRDLSSWADFTILGIFGGPHVQQDPVGAQGPGQTALPPSQQTAASVTRVILPAESPLHSRNRSEQEPTEVPVFSSLEPNVWVKIANTGNLKFEDTRNHLSPSGSVTGIVSNPSLDVFLLYRIVRECGPFIGERVVPGRPVPGGCIDPVENWHASAATVDAVGNWTATPCSIPRTYSEGLPDFDYWELLAVATRERSAVENQIVQLTCGISTDALCRARVTTSEPRVVLRTRGPGYAIWQEYAPSPRSVCSPK